MVAPVAKGVIIAASVIVAAGIAIYENPQVRQWVDQRRRKIAVALHNLGDDINPGRRRSSSSSQRTVDAEELRRRRERNELVRKAREEGIAVDLDELARIGSDRPREKGGSARGASFDDLVHEDGTLKQSSSTITEKATTTAAESVPAPQDGLRQRGGAGARGFLSGVTYANPFADEDAQVLFDRDLIGAEEASVDGSHIDEEDAEEAPVPHDFLTSDSSRSTSATLEASETLLQQSHLVDLSEPFAPPFQQAAAPIPIPEQPLSEAADTEDDPAAASFYSFASDASQHAAAADAPLAASAQHSDFISDADSDSDADDLLRSAGTMTPTDDGFSSAASLIGDSSVTADNDYYDDVAVHEDLDARSEAGNTDASFSEISATGAHTPSSWSDVGSDVESEYGSSHATSQH